MKKSLSILVVILLTAIGAEALASALDIQIQKLVKDTSDAQPGGNGNTGGRNKATLEK